MCGNGLGGRLGRAFLRAVEDGLGQFGALAGGVLEFQNAAQMDRMEGLLRSAMEQNQMNEAAEAQTRQILAESVQVSARLADSVTTILSTFTLDPKTRDILLIDDEVQVEAAVRGVADGCWPTANPTLDSIGITLRDGLELCPYRTPNNLWDDISPAGYLRSDFPFASDVMRDAYSKFVDRLWQQELDVQECVLGILARRNRLVSFRSARVSYAILAARAAAGGG